MPVFSFHTFVILISVSKKRDTERITTLPYAYKWQKFNKMNEKRTQRYQNVGAEYVTGKINSLILRLLFRRFYRLIFAPPQKSKYIVICCFPNDRKYSSN